MLQTQDGVRSMTAGVVILAAVAGQMSLTGRAHGDVIWGNAADRTILDLSTDLLIDNGSAEVGNNGGIMRTYVVPFQLPARPAGTVVTAADVRFDVLRNMQSSVMNVDLYALTPRASSAVLATDLYAGPLDAAAGATLIQDNFVTVAGTDINSYVELHTNAGGDAALAAYLNSAYTTHGAGAWVFLRLSCDNAAAPNINFYFVHSANTSWQAPRIELTFGVVPTPATAALAGAGALVMARRRRR
ncbi:MAG TPA: hypothetical protein VFF65_14105 [Phycisphaerales bacterium]|nr:hypothetical protein [Phycisphaerales bacterium]